MTSPAPIPWAMPPLRSERREKEMPITARINADQGKGDLAVEIDDVPGRIIAFRLEFPDIPFQFNVTHRLDIFLDHLEIVGRFRNIDHLLLPLSS